MAANPGHYVATVITIPQSGGAGDGAASASATAPMKHLKLLCPYDTLRLGRVYRPDEYVLGHVRSPVTSCVRIWFGPECYCFTVTAGQLFRLAPSFSHVAFCCRSN
jgi:hypothetical protein